MRIGVISVLLAVWGVAVDANFIPILAPSGNSTIMEATTAAPSALLGIWAGPLAGALPGIIRDGSLYLALAVFHHSVNAHPEMLRAHPHLLSIRPWSLPFLGRALADIGEDVMIGVIPGLVARRTRRITVLTAATATATWLSLPLLVAANVLLLGHGGVIQALLTHRPDWDAPVDPGLIVYALATAALTASALTYRFRGRRPVAVAVLLAVASLLLITAGAPA